VKTREGERELVSLLIYLRDNNRIVVSEHPNSKKIIGRAEHGWNNVKCVTIGKNLMILVSQEELANP